MDISPTRSLGGLDCSLIWLERLELFQDLLRCRHGCLLPGPCASSTVVDCVVRRTGAEYWTLSTSPGAQLGVSLAGPLWQQDCLWTAAGMG